MTPGPTRPELAGLAVVAALGALHLPYPFHGDQALFAIVGRQVAEGAVLYRDAWDVKQPGIFWLYGGAGVLFGHGEVGVHLLELILWLAFSALLIAALRDRFRSPLAAGSLAVLTAGAYYASVLRPMLLTQIEMLVGAPLFVSLWLATSRGSDGRRIAAGVAGGTALLFKLLLAPLLVAIWAVALAGAARDAPDRRAATVARHAFALALGAAVPLGLAVLDLGRDGALEIAAWTTFVYPGQAMDLAPRPLSRLATSVGWFAVFYAPVLALAGFRLGARDRAPLDRLDAGLLAWLLAGAALILLQLWWPYHLYLLAVPLGILAAKGLDALLARPRPARRAAVAALFVLALPALGLSAHKALVLARTGLGLTPAARRAYQAAHEELYRTVPAQAAAVAARAPSTEPMYVFGDPLFLLLTGRRQAIPLSGWSPEMWTDAMWSEAVTGIEAARPATIVVETWAEEVLRERSPAMVRLLARDYRPVGRWPEAVWYTRVSER